jgi:hypothetical protein
MVLGVSETVTEILSIPDWYRFDERKGRRSALGVVTQAALMEGADLAEFLSAFDGGVWTPARLVSALLGGMGTERDAEKGPGACEANPVLIPTCRINRLPGIIEIGESKMTGLCTMATEKSDDDKKRDEGLLRMLKTRPKRNVELKIGKPRKPGRRKTQKKKQNQ